MLLYFCSIGKNHSLAAHSLRARLSRDPLQIHRVRRRRRVSPTATASLIGAFGPIRAWYSCYASSGNLLLRVLSGGATVGLVKTSHWQLAMGIGAGWGPLIKACHSNVHSALPRNSPEWATGCRCLISTNEDQFYFTYLSFLEQNPLKKWHPEKRRKSTGILSTGAIHGPPWLETNHSHGRNSQNAPLTFLNSMKNMVPFVDGRGLKTPPPPVTRFFSAANK